MLAKNLRYHFYFAYFYPKELLKQLFHYQETALPHAFKKYEARKSEASFTSLRGIVSVPTAPLHLCFEVSFYYHLILSV